MKNGYSREEFLTSMPMLTDWLESMEELWGGMIRYACLKLSDDRMIFVMRFEKVFHINFFNPSNGKAEQDKVVNLSPEALFALIGLTHNIVGEKDWCEQWQIMTEMIVANNPITKFEGGAS